MARFIGLMSGTSLDGVDAVLVDFEEAGSGSSSNTIGIGMRVLGHVHRPFDAALRDELLRLQGRGDNELHRAALASNGVARAYAACVDALLHESVVHRSSVVALGAHGQTVRHQPQAFDGTGYTLQLLNAAVLAELAGIDVVSDLRSRDVAAGGQGAPLVPAFHAWAFSGRVDHGAALAVLNVGGMANISVLHADGRVAGFDTGPGGALLDAWCLRHRGVVFDDAGTWAASGRVDGALLRSMSSEAFFARSPPKSTGRDVFHLGWVDDHIQRAGSSPAPVDVQATLAELTAATVAEALAAHATDAHALIVCGGGARNIDVLARLQQHLPNVRVSTSSEHGVPVDQVEALAFAWLAYRFVHCEPGNLPAVTGARAPRRLGALYPAR